MREPDAQIQTPPAICSTAGEFKQFIDVRGEMGWGEGSGRSEEEQQRPEQIALRLRQDFEALLKVATEVSAACQETIYITMNEIGIRAAQGGLDEGRRVKVVTYLAFIFIPPALIAAIFGMNVRELERNPPLMWLFWAIAMPVVFVSILVPVLVGRRGGRDVVGPLEAVGLRRLGWSAVL